MVSSLMLLIHPYKPFNRSTLPQYNTLSPITNSLFTFAMIIYRLNHTRQRHVRCLTMFRRPRNQSLGMA